MFMHACPACSSPVELFSQRYDGCVCNRCSSRLTDSAGTPVQAFEDVRERNGVLVQYGDKRRCDEATDACMAYIDGVQYRLVQGRFGGVLAMPL